MVWDYLPRIFCRVKGVGPGREVIVGGERYRFREGPALCNAVFGAEKEEIGPENTYFLHVKP
jgi:hypothetical protein